MKQIQTVAQRPQVGRSPLVEKLYFILIAITLINVIDDNFESLLKCLERGSDRNPI
ncbi:hypothetical protein [Nostoc sp.]|uniref:hypothetical protein n=1 Tax=Nostoc sp. TaxID=1180 RepID=UPI002FFD23B3